MQGASARKLEGAQEAHESHVETVTTKQEDRKIILSNDVFSLSVAFWLLSFLIYFFPLIFHFVVVLTWCKFNCFTTSILLFSVCCCKFWVLKTDAAFSFTTRCSFRSLFLRGWLPCPGHAIVTCQSQKLRSPFYRRLHNFSQFATLLSHSRSS